MQAFLAYWTFQLFPVQQNPKSRVSLGSLFSVTYSLIMPALPQGIYHSYHHILGPLDRASPRCGKLLLVPCAPSPKSHCCWHLSLYLPPLTSLLPGCSDVLGWLWLAAARHGGVYQCAHHDSFWICWLVTAQFDYGSSHPGFLRRDTWRYTQGGEMWRRQTCLTDKLCGTHVAWPAQADRSSNRCGKSWNAGLPCKG